MISAVGEVEPSNRAYVLKSVLRGKVEIIMWNKIMSLYF